MAHASIHMENGRATTPQLVQLIWRPEWEPQAESPYEQVAERDPACQCPTFQLGLHTAQQTEPWGLEFLENCFSSRRLRRFSFLMIVLLSLAVILSSPNAAQMKLTSITSALDDFFFVSFIFSPLAGCSCYVIFFINIGEGIIYRGLQGLLKQTICTFQWLVQLAISYPASQLASWRIKQFWFDSPPAC